MKKVLLTFILLGLLSAQPVFADEKIVFPPGSVQIKESIKYTVVGRYHCGFDKSHGYLTLDEKTREIKSVYLELEAASIRSKHPSLDNIVRSPQLLDVKKYPLITFQSQSIEKNENGYSVVGDLTMHGVTKQFSSPFNVTRDGAGAIKLNGKWTIKRKDFGIIWNRFLDKGGVLVGDYISVEWEINLPPRGGLPAQGGRK
jgi:polyisoprenoid-binding protein YceI